MSINIREFVKRAGESKVQFEVLASELEENTENTAFCFSEENDPWELGLVRLFKRKTCHCLAFVLYKRESLPSKFPECKETINEA